MRVPVSMLTLILHYRTKFLRCYRKASMTPVLVFLIGIGIIAVAIGLLALRKAHSFSRPTRKNPRLESGPFWFALYSVLHACQSRGTPP
jgi:hypothetical protein